MTTETDNPFEKVLDRLREKGWMKGGYGYEQGPNCIAGGIKKVLGIPVSSRTNKLPLVEELVPIIRAQYPEWRGPMHDVPNFNDHPDTTFSDVERVLEKAAVKWEEERVLRHD